MGLPPAAGGALSAPAGPLAPAEPLERPGVGLEVEDGGESPPASFAGVDPVPVARFAMSSLGGPVDGHSLPEVPPAGAAAFSRCGRYRWWLRRCWDPARPPLLFVGLNPSRADGHRADPTLRRLLSYAAAWGFGSLEVLNLFALVATDPALLRRSADPVGRRNDAWIRRALRRRPQAPVWIGWGNQGRWWGRDQELLALLERLGRGPLALDRTAAGLPRHPLYCPARLTLRSFAAS